MQRIPNIDLRRTKPLGEPYVPPKPMRQGDTRWISKTVVYAPTFAFLFALSLGILALFGPLVGFTIIFFFVVKFFSSQSGKS